jgi:uncharacterized protein (TIGR02186 family)
VTAAGRTGHLRAAALCCFALSCFASCCFGHPAAAETLVLTIAPNRIAIAANYDGGAIVVFGAVQRDGAPPRLYDVVVTVAGPRQTVVVRRKERIAGIWINAQSHTFDDVPSFLAVLANRPLDAIASAQTLRNQQIGLKDVLVARANVEEGNSYLSNFIRTRMDEKFYHEIPNAVTFLSETMFRAGVPLPPNVLTGAYDVEVKLFSSGAMIAQTSAMFSVVKVGVEELVARAAIDDSLIYGLAMVAMALLTGWLASVAFRRD